MNRKRFLAIIAIFLLILPYAATFILAFCDFPGCDRILAGFLMLDIAMPVFIWILLFIYRHFGSHDK